MTREEAKTLIESYEALVQKAIQILQPQGPPWGYISEPAFARLTFDGDDAVISEPKADSYYDSCSIETETTRFPAALLFMSADELSAWRVQARAAYEKEQHEAGQRRVAEQEAAEWRTYEQLKRKFEND